MSIQGSRRTLRKAAAVLLLALLAAACNRGAPTAVPVAPSVAAPVPVSPGQVAVATEEPTTEEPTEEPTTEEPTEEPTTEEPTEEPTATPEPAATGDDFSFEEEFDAPEMSVPVEDAPYSDYALITDDTGAVQVAVPVEWADVDGAPFTDDAGRQYYDVRAASDLEAFQTTWSTPGVIVTASQDAAQSQNEITLLDSLRDNSFLTSDCTYDGRFDYADQVYTGAFDSYVDCGGVGAEYLVIGAVPTSRAFVLLVQIQINSERDLEALDNVIATFEVVGDV